MRFPFVLLVGLATALAPPAARAAQECGSTPYECAAFHASRGEFVEAIRLIEQVLARPPSDLKALNLGGIALTGAGRIDEANARFREAIRLDPRFYPALKNLAINEFTAGRSAGRPGPFRRSPEAGARRPGRARPSGRDRVRSEEHRGRAPALRESRSPHLAKPGVGAALRIVPARPAAPGPGGRGSRCAAPGRRGQPVRGRDAPRPQRRARRRGAILRQRQGPIQGSRRRRLQPDADARGSRPLRCGRPRRAGAVRPRTQSSELYNLVARAHEQAGRVKEAYDALRTATQIAPSAEENYVDLASICLDHQNFDLGLEIIDIGLRHRPDSSLLHLQRGVLMAMRAELGPAEAEFEPPAAWRRSAAAYAGLAMIWMQTGHTEQAVDVLRKEAQARHDHVVPYMFAVALMRSGVDPAGPGAAEAIAALQCLDPLEPAIRAVAQ